jgi:hypothetical protein
MMRSLYHGGVVARRRATGRLDSRSSDKGRLATAGECVEQRGAKTAARLDKRPKTVHTQRLLHAV